MATIISSDRFRLGKALQQAARQNDAPTSKDDEIRFYFRDVFADNNAIQNWCARLGKALGADVEFTGGGHPMPKIKHSNFQINVRLRGDNAQTLENLLQNNDFKAFVDKSRNYNNQDMLYAANTMFVQDISDNNADDWYPSGFSTPKTSAPKMSAAERLAHLSNTHTNTKLLFADLNMPNRKEMLQSYDVFFNLMKMVTLRTAQDQDPQLTPQEATTLHTLSQSIKNNAGKKFAMLEPSFLKFSLLLNGWNPAHQDILHARHLINITPKVEDNAPTLDS